MNITTTTGANEQTTAADPTIASGLTAPIGQNVVSNDLDALLDCCPTCLSYGGGLIAGDMPEYALDACPTCGVASYEWTVATQIDALLTEMAGFESLAVALAL